MYWSRTGDLLDIVAWLGACALWWTGGWLLSTHLFHLKPRERLFSGLAIGMVSFITTSNLLGQIFEIRVAFWLAAALVFVIGLGFTWRSPAKRWFDVRDIRQSWGQILVFGGFLGLFVMINRGLAIFDDNNNLPLVSQVAIGDIPPHFYLDSEQRLDYHYGLHLLAASFVRIGGFYPWSALDVSKSLSLAILPILAWLWFRRLVKPKQFALWGAVFVMLASGTRWALLFIPEKSLARLSSEVQLTGSAQESGPELYQALNGAWKIEGGSPFPFPFAFANGIRPPAILSLTGYGAMPQLTLVLWLLLARRSRNAFQKAILGVILASLALTGEHLFAMLWAGIFLVVVGGWLANRHSCDSFKDRLQWVWMLLPALLAALLGGGVLTEAAGRILTSTLNQGSTSGIGFGSIGLRLPPAIISAHLGSLSLINPRQWVVIMAEIGPLPLLFIPLVYLGWVQFRRRDWVIPSLTIAAAFGLIFPTIIQLSIRDRDIARVTGMALFIAMVIGFPYVVLVWRKSSRTARSWLFGGYLITILSGVSLIPSLLVATAQVQPSYFISELDAQMSQIYWNNLEMTAKIFDPAYASRPATLFARNIGSAYQDFNTPRAEYTSLLNDPDPTRVANAGYTYYYMDGTTWKSLSDPLKSAFVRTCIKPLAKIQADEGDFRILYDIRQCQE